MVGCPSANDFESVTKNNSIDNCPVVSEDASTAQEVCGQDVGALKGKTVWKKSPTVMADCVATPKETLLAHKNVTLTQDITHINKHAFLVPHSRNLQFRTIKCPSNRTFNNALAKMDSTTDLHNCRKFKTKTALADPEFEVFKNDTVEKHINANAASAEEHAAKTERQNRVVEERVRA